MSRAAGDNVVALERLAYPVPDAAHQIGISRAYLWALIADGEIDTFTIGRRRLVSRDALQDFINRRTSDS